MTTRVKRIRITNLFGIKDLEFLPGTLTILSGSAGTGKSSVLNAIKWLLDGGSHHPAAVRRRCNEGHLEMDLTDGTAIRMRVIPTDTFRHVHNPDGTVVEQAMAKKAIETMFDVWDPSEILLMDSKQLAKKLVEVMPLTFTPTELGRALQKYNPVTEPVSLGGLASIRNTIYNLRHDVNGHSARAKKTQERLKQLLPAGGADIEQLRNDRKELEASKLRVQQVLLEEHNQLCAELDQRVEALRKAYQEARAERTAMAEPKLAEINENIGKTDALIEQASRAEAINNELESARNDELTHNLTSGELTHILNHIDALKTSKLKNLPIPDLAVDIDKLQVFYQGLPWTLETPNTSVKLMLGFQVGSLQHEGKLPFYVCDHTSEFDGATLDDLRQSLKAVDYQAVVTRVTIEPQELTVITDLRQ